MNWNWNTASTIEIVIVKNPESTKDIKMKTFFGPCLHLRSIHAWQPWIATIFFFCYANTTILREFSPLVPHLKGEKKQAETFFYLQTSQVKGLFRQAMQQSIGRYNRYVQLGYWTNIG